MSKSKKRHHTETAVDASTIGQRLLSLARSPYDDVGATIQTFVSAIRIVQARGILQGNQQLAEQVLRNATLSDGGGGGGGGKKKRKNRRVGDQQQQSKQPTLDVQLLLLACLRGLECNDNNDHDEPWLPCLAADLMTAAIQYIQDTYTSPPTLLFLAEFELISGSAKALLTALLPHATQNSTARTAVLRTATRCISLMPHRWKRSAALISQWRELPASSLSPKLYAALAMVATTETAVAQQWSQHVEDTTRTTERLVQRLTMTTSSASPQEQTYGTWHTVVITQWLPAVQAAATEQDVAHQIVRYIDILVQTITSLLTRDTLGRGSAAAAPVLQHLQSARMHLGLLLSACQALSSFPATAQGLWKKTKKRLRKEPLEHGLRLSPATLVGPFGMQLQAQGHRLLDVLVRSLGATVLLPYSRRLFRDCYQILESTTPVVLRSLVDPAHLVTTATTQKTTSQTTCTSIAAQVSAFSSLGSLVVGLGLDTTQDATGKAITIACGHVISLLGGTMDASTMRYERQGLFVAALDFLTQCLNCGGELLLHDIRELIDSVAYTCCVTATDAQHVLLAGNEQMHNKLCDLCVAVLTTPHVDGASCDARVAQEIARLARSQPSWAQSASTLHICNALSAPRLPALHVVASRPRTSHGQPDSVTALLSRIATAHEDLLQLQRPSSVPTNVRNQNQSSSMDVPQDTVATTATARQPPAETIVPQPKKSEPVSSAPAPTEDVAANKTIVEPMMSSTIDRSKVMADDSEDDFDMPVIVDCGPDEEDE